MQPANLYQKQQVQTRYAAKPHIYVFGGGKGQCSPHGNTKVQYKLDASCRFFNMQL